MNFNKPNKRIILTSFLSLLMPFSFASAKNFIIHDSSDANNTYFSIIGTTGYIGLGVSSPSTLLQLKNNNWISALDVAGTGVVNMFKVNTSNQIEVGAPLNIGSFEFTPDSGLVTFADMAVTSASPIGTPESYVFKLDGENIMSIYSESNGAGGIQNKRVGIGTTAPTQALEVAGTIYSSTGGFKLPDGTIVDSQSDLTPVTPHTQILVGDASDVAVATSTLTILDSGNVGIGTTAPTNKLHVKIDAESTLAVLLENNGTGTTARDVLKLVSSGTGNGTKVFEVQSSGGTTEGLVVMGSGNVGIGTTAPSGILHTYALTGNNSLYIDSFTDNSFLHLRSNLDGLGGEESGIIFSDGTSGKWELYKNSNNNFSIYDYTRAGISFDIADNGDMSLMQSGGNVGIGTTNPSQKLHVSGGSALFASTEGILLSPGTTAGIIGHDGSAYNDLELRAQAGTQLYLKSDGNVGIGTTGPETKFQVTGTAGTQGSAGHVRRIVSLYDDTAQATGVGSGIVFGGKYTDAGLYTQFGGIYARKDNGTTGNYGASLNFFAREHGDAVLNPDMVISSSGNVGIGTTGPTTELMVQGANGITHKRNTDNAGGTLKLGAGTGLVTLMSSNLVNGDLSIKDDTGAVMVHIKADGNVGIGTTGPGSPLEVATVPSTGEKSSIQFGSGGHLLSTSVPMAGFSGGAYFNYNGSSYQWIPEDTGASTFQMYNVAKGDFAITTNNGLTAGVAYTPTPRLVITPTGNVGLGGSITNYSTLAGSSLTINNGNVGIGTTSPVGNLHITDSVGGGNYHLILEDPDASADEKQWVMRTITGQLDFRTRTDSGTQSTKLTVLNNGNVGIGTTSPTDKLDVAGNIRLTHTSPDLDFMANGGHYNWRIAAQENVNNALEITPSTAVDGSTFSTPAVTILSTGNVGIGTTAPNSQLQLTHDTTTITTEADYAFSIKPDLTAELFMGVNTTGGYSFIQSFDPGTNWNGKPLILMPNGGNIGIGTTAPGAKLHISGGSGIIENAGVVSLTLKDSSSTSIPTLYFVQGATTQASIQGGTAVQGRLDFNTYNNPNTMTLFNGNVGIGTTNPGAKLEVNGKVKLTTGNSLLSTYVGDLAETGGYMETSTTNLKFVTRNGHIVFDTTAGNVGIGTTNPGAKLEVAGNIELSGASRYITVDGGNLYLDPSDGVVNLYDNVDDFALNVYSGSTLKAKVNSNGNSYFNGGNVGIGTTAPDALLDIYNGALVNRASAVNHYRNVLSQYLGVGNQVGTLKIVLPKQSDTMIDITIKGYDYSANIGAWEVRISGYVYSGTGGWYTLNHKAQIIGSAPFSKVRLSYDGSKPIILLGDTSTVWSYSSIEVSDVTTSYAGITGWGSGWTASLITDETGLTLKATPLISTYTTASGNVGIGTTAPNSKLTVGYVGSNTANGLIGSFFNGDETTVKILGTANTNDTGAHLQLMENNPALYGFDTWYDTGNNKLFIDSYTNDVKTNVMAMTTTGNVGIGTTAPGAKLDVNGTSYLRGKTTINSAGEIASGYAPLHINQAVANSVVLDEETTTAGLNIRGYSDNVNLQLGVGGVSLGYNSWIQASYDNGGSSTGTEALLLNPVGGNVGIGTTGPQGMLQVGARAQATPATYPGRIIVGGTAGSTLESEGGVEFPVADDGYSYKIQGLASSGSVLAFGNRTASATWVERMRINPVGNVGIGTTVPDESLDVNGAIQAKSGAPSAFNANHVGYTFSSETDGGMFSPADGNIVFASNGTERMRIDNAGNIGIGTTAPSTKFQVKDGGATFSFKEVPMIFNAEAYVTSANSMYSSLYLGDASHPQYAGLTYDSSGNALSILSNNAARITINSAGNVGIGTTAPSAKLQVQVSNNGLNIVNGLRNENATESGGNAVGVGFLNEPNGDWWKAAIVHERTGGYGIGDLRFLVDSAIDSNSVGLTDTKMIIKSTGNVGIGVVDPGSLLSLANNNWISEKNAAGSGYVNMFKVNTDNEIDVGTTLNAGTFEFAEDSGTVTAMDMPVSSSASAGTDEAYTFKVDGTNILTVFAESNGAGGIQNPRVGIGDSTPSYQLELSTNSAAKPTSSSWTVSSDERLKDVNEDFPRGLEAIMGLYPMYMNYKVDNPLGLPSDQEFIGLVAQDVEKVIPEAVKTDVNGYLTIDADPIKWTMINAIKELGSKISGSLEENFGIGTVIPYRKLQVEEAGENPQMRIAYDESNYAEMQVSAVGDLALTARGGDVRLPDDNLMVCSGGACPTKASALNGTGNLVVENIAYVAGALGIGTESPERPLDIYETQSNPQMRISYDDDLYSEFKVSATGDLSISAQGGDVSVLDENFRVCSGEACPSELYSASGRGNLLVENNILALGNVGINTATPDYTLDVKGTLRAYGITDASDIRLKKNIRSLVDTYSLDCHAIARKDEEQSSSLTNFALQNSSLRADKSTLGMGACDVAVQKNTVLENVMKLRGVKFEWKDSELGVGDQIGFIAQEVEKVYPELVSTDQDGYKSVQYGKMTAVLVGAIQELTKLFEGTKIEYSRLDNRTTELEKENQELKTKTVELENRIKALENIFRQK
ncbi:MAG: tail fiber domain-containing protein [Patescibacteria group bacterium]